MAKINFFEGFKDNGSKVSKYVYNRAMKKGLSMRYNDLIKIAEDNLAKIDNLKDCVIEAKKDEKIAIINRIEALKKERDEKVERYKYTMTEADKNLRKRVKDATTTAQIYTALQLWLKVQFNLTGDDHCGFIKGIIDAAGDKIDWKLFNESKGVKLTVYNVTNLLTMAYCKLYERLVELDFIKAVDVPAPMRDHYENIKKAKDMKKQIAKSRKGRKSTVDSLK